MLCSGNGDRGQGCDEQALPLPSGSEDERSLRVSAHSFAGSVFDVLAGPHREGCDHMKEGGVVKNGPPELEMLSCVSGDRFLQVEQAAEVAGALWS